MTLRRRVWDLLEPDLDDFESQSSWLDGFLVALILLNVVAVVLESVSALAAAHGAWFLGFEIFSVAIFTVEYGARVWSSVERKDHRAGHNPVLSRLKFAATPLALIDIAAILPFFLQILFPGADLRFIRILRMARIFKLTRYFNAFSILVEAISKERRAFGAAAFILGFVLILAACGIYLFEHNVQPEALGSIPAAMWWAVATLTTVGYGDIVPMTAGGKVFGGLVSIIGICMIALPAGILASAINDMMRQRERRYEAELLRTLEDGRISPMERERLDNLKKRLGISEDTARILRLEAIANLPPDEVSCPHCGQPVEVPIEVT